jgi:hypothetical protein
MEASLDVSCMVMPRTDYNGSLPFHLFSQLPPERKAKLIKEYSERKRFYNISNFQFDTQFRITYPGPSELNYKSLVSNVPELTFKSVKATTEVKIDGSQLLPAMGDTLYVDFQTSDRSFDKLLEQYKLPTDGEPPRSLTPYEYLSYLKKSNKALEAGIYVLKSWIKVAAAKVADDAAAKVADDAAAKVAVDAAAAEDQNKQLNKLYHNHNLTDPQPSIYENSYYALNLSRTLEGSITQVAEILKEQASPLESIISKMKGMTNNEKVEYIYSTTGINLYSYIE